MRVPSRNILNALTILREKKRMSLEEFARAMGYSQYNVKYMIQTAIPRALMKHGNEEIVRCFRIVRDVMSRNYYTEWVCND